MKVCHEASPSCWVKLGGSWRNCSWISHWVSKTTINEPGLRHINTTAICFKLTRNKFKDQNIKVIKQRAEVVSIHIQFTSFFQWLWVPPGVPWWCLHVVGSQNMSYVPKPLKTNRGVIFLNIPRSLVGSFIHANESNFKRLKVLALFGQVICGPVLQKTPLTNRLGG